MILTQGAFNPLIRGGLRKEFRDKWDEYQPNYPDFLKVESTDTPEQMAAIITGPSRLLELGDTEPVSYVSPKMGPVVAGVDKEFGAGIAIGRKIMEDDQYGKIKGAAQWLAHSARMTDEYRSAALLDDAFTGTTFKGYDGLALCSTAHTFINAGSSSSTWANRPAADIGLSVTGISAMLDLFMTAKDHNGDPARLMPDTIVISNVSGEYNKALQILGSDKEPFTADNQDNAIKKRIGGIKIVVSIYKASTKSYFMIDSRYNDARFVRRRPLKLEDDFDFHTGAALFKATTRFLIWFVDPRGWAGTNPA